MLEKDTGLLFRSRGSTVCKLMLVGGKIRLIVVTESHQYYKKMMSCSYKENVGGGGGGVINCE